jgi:hypothetical protein
MRYFLLLVLAAALGAGCQKPEEAPKAVENEVASQPAGTGNADPGIMPSAAAGGMAPVTNPGAVEGAGGGGIGMAAKGMARGAAEQASTPSGFDDSGE